MIRTLASGLLFTALSAVPAAAQLSLGGSGDTQVAADDAVSANGVTTLSGQVDVRQGDVRILANKMVIFSANRGTAGSGPSVAGGIGDVERIVATGEFYYITPEQEVRGDRGVYTAASDQFDVTGNVVLVQDDSVVRGDRLIYDLSTERARVLSECKGRRCGRARRVNILIKSNGQSASQS